MKRAARFSLPTPGVFMVPIDSLPGFCAFQKKLSHRTTRSVYERRSLIFLNSLVLCVVTAPFHHATLTQSLMREKRVKSRCFRPRLFPRLFSLFLFPSSGETSRDSRRNGKSVADTKGRSRIFAGLKASTAAPLINLTRRVIRA